MTNEKFRLESGRLWHMLLNRAAEHGARTSLLKNRDIKNPERRAWLKQSTVELKRLDAEIKAQVALLTAPWTAEENHQRMIESNDECLELAAGFAAQPRNSYSVN
jgi:hypothetical protein